MGAHIRRRRHDDFSYVETVEYKKYRKKYLQFLRQEAPHLSAYSNLDVINNAELTYKNQQWFEERGVRPLPVWHYGSDVSWLDKYVAAGYDYICIGGMVPNPTTVLRPALDRLWRQHLTDVEGMPKVKVHGFAMTSFVLMYRYPWYSVDSKSWIDHARFGFILVPPIKRDGSFDWIHPIRVGVSNFVVDKRNPKTHIRFMHPAARRMVMRYLDELEIPLGKSTFHKEKDGYDLKKNEVWLRQPSDGKEGVVEEISEYGVSTKYSFRMDANLCIYRKIEEVVPPWPWSIKRTLTKFREGILP